MVFTPAGTMPMSDKFHDKLIAAADKHAAAMAEVEIVGAPPCQLRLLAGQEHASEMGYSAKSI